MLSYLIRRILATIPVIGMVAFFVFSLLYLTPGDPAAVIAGDIATNEDIERIREKLGLDQPFFTRFGTWAWGVAAGRPRHLDLHQPARDAAHRPAHRADALAGDLHAHRLRARRRAARRHRRLAGRHVRSTAA